MNPESDFSSSAHHHQNNHLPNNFIIVSENQRASIITANSNNHHGNLVGQLASGHNFFSASSSSASSSLLLSSSSSIYIKSIIGSFLVLVILVSIFGNLLVCVAIASDRRLRRLGNIFLVSLAIADLCVGALVMTFALANDLLDYWPFGPQLCEIWIAFDISCSTCSIINLCAIALDRFMHIKDPMRYNRWMNKRIVIGCVSIIWIISCLISFLPISLGWHKPSPQAMVMTLDEDQLRNNFLLGPNSTNNPLFPFENENDGLDLGQPSQRLLMDDDHQPDSLLHQQVPSIAMLRNQMIIETYYQQQQKHRQDDNDVEEEDSNDLPQCALDLTPTYAVVSSCISFYLPCLVMVYLYVKLYSICQQHVKSIKSMSKPFGTINTNHNNNDQLNQKNSSSSPDISSSATLNMTTLQHHHHQQQQQQQQQKESSQVSEHKAAITLGIIMGTFLACWMPFFCINIVAANCKTCIPPLMFKILSWLGYFNSCLNPAIYSIFNTEFRDAFRRILVRYVFPSEMSRTACQQLFPCTGRRSGTRNSHLSNLHQTVVDTETYHHHPSDDSNQSRRLVVVNPGRTLVPNDNGHSKMLKTSDGSKPPQPNIMNPPVETKSENSGFKTETVKQARPNETTVDLESNQFPIKFELSNNHEDSMMITNTMTPLLRSSTNNSSQTSTLTDLVPISNNIPLSPSHSLPLSRDTRYATNPQVHQFHAKNHRIKSFDL